MTDKDRHTTRVRDQFTRQAAAYAETDQARDASAMAALVRLSGVGEDDEVLDVACGPGRMTAAFARVCGYAVGCDATDALIEIGRREAGAEGLSNIRFDAGDVYSLPYEDASFSLVACRAAFHHFAEPGLALREMIRVAKPEGRLLIADIIGNEDEILAANHDAIERLCDPTHVRALPASEFRQLFEANRLEELSLHSGEMTYEVEAWIAHGGPDEGAAEEIRRLLRESAAEDNTGLKVAVTGDTVRFSHQTGVFLLGRQGARRLP